jgi:hypothetical protein
MAGGGLCALNPSVSLGGGGDRAAVLVSGETGWRSLVLHRGGGRRVRGVWRRAPELTLMAAA